MDNLLVIWRERAEQERDKILDHVQWCKAHEIVDILDDVIIWHNTSDAEALDWLYVSYKRANEEAARCKHLLITMNKELIDYGQQQQYYEKQLTRYEQKKQDWFTIMQHFYNVTPERWGKVYEWRKGNTN